MTSTDGYFRQDNTDGYSDYELSQLNRSLYAAVKARGLSFNPDSQDADQVQMIAELLLRTFDSPR